MQKRHLDAPGLLLKILPFVTDIHGFLCQMQTVVLDITVPFASSFEETTHRSPQ